MKRTHKGALQRPILLPLNRAGATAPIRSHPWGQTRDFRRDAATAQGCRGGGWRRGSLPAARSSASFSSQASASGTSGNCFRTSSISAARSGGRVMARYWRKGTSAVSARSFLSGSSSDL
eukprot:scaffold102972_cov40-Phaeocystis_antarctica.AAC.1